MSEHSDQWFKYAAEKVHETAAEAYVATHTLESQATQLTKGRGSLFTSIRQSLIKLII